MSKFSVNVDSDGRVRSLEDKQTAELADQSYVFLAPLITVFPLFFILLAWLTARLTKSRYLTAAMNFPASWLISNCILALLLIPVAFVVGAHNRGMDIISWVGEITFMKQLWFPLLLDFWTAVFNVLLAAERPYGNLYFPSGPVVANPVLVIVLQVAMWFLFGRMINRFLTNLMIR